MKYKAFHKMSYGLYIITTIHDGKKSGYVGNTVFQITSNPEQIAISCHKDNTTTDEILKSKKFAVSVLKKDSDTSIIGKFGFMSSDEVNKFLDIRTTTAVTGAPVILSSSVAWFDCEVVSNYDVGTHILITGVVRDCDILSDEKPLTYEYYREKYKMLSPKNSPTHIDKDILDKEKTGVEEEAEPVYKEPYIEQDDAGSYTCSICGYQYNPEEGDPTADIPPGTPFEDLPEDYRCPVCNAGKEYFKKD